MSEITGLAFTYGGATVKYVDGAWVPPPQSSGVSCDEETCVMPTGEKIAKRGTSVWLSLPRYVFLVLHPHLLIQL